MYNTPKYNEDTICNHLSQRNLRLFVYCRFWTDSAHPMTHDEITNKLDLMYNVTIERKAIGRNIALLQDVGYDVETTKKGSYLNSRLFEDSELRLLSDSVLASQHITAKHSKALIEKLSTLSNKYFKSHIKNVYSVNDWNKSENVALFYNIEVIDEAIEKNRKIKFDYNKYGKDKKFHRSAIHTVSPYQMILHNQRYFLMAYQEKWQHISYFRLDRITNIELLEDNATNLRSIDGYKNGIDYKRFSSALPYMFSDEPENISFIIEGEWMIDQVVDWFGFDFKTQEMDGRHIVTVKASPYAMEYWAMQYLNSVEIISPLSLREQIKENISKAKKKYD